MVDRGPLSPLSDEVVSELGAIVESFNDLVRSATDMGEHEFREYYPQAYRLYYSTQKFLVERGLANEVAPVELTGDRDQDIKAIMEYEGRLWDFQNRCKQAQQVTTGLDAVIENGRAPRAQIIVLKAEGNQVFTRILDAIDRHPPLGPQDDEAPAGIGHNQPDETLDEIRDVVQEAIGVFEAPEPDAGKLVSIWEKIGNCRTILAATFVGSFGLAAGTTSGELAAAWFAEFLSYLLRQAELIIERMIELSKLAT